MAMKPYVVRQGDYLTKLAGTMNFSAEDVWGAAENADLKKLRSDMDMLLPGDLLSLPDTPPPKTPLSGGTSNDYTAALPKVDVKLTLLDLEGKAIANKSYTVYGLGDPLPGQTDGSGSLTLPVTIDVREAHLVLDEEGSVFQLAIGDMDPIEEMIGVKKRLAHLGLFTVLDSGDDDIEALRLKGALSTFQQAQGLPVTGDLDDSTRAALAKAHGS